LSEALLYLRQGREERLVTELTLIRLTRPETSIDADALNVRLDRLEQRLHSAAAPPVAVDPGPPPSPSPTPPLRQEEPQPKPSTTKEEPKAKPPATEAIEEPLPAPAPRPQPAAAAPAGTPVDIDLATFESAWPAIAARIRDLAGPSKHALLKEAQPVGVTSGTVTFELPSHLPFHLQQLRADRELHELLRRAATELVGGPVDVEFRSHADEPAKTPSEPTRAPDKDDLLDEDDGGIDPTELVVDILGGEVVDE